MAGIARAHLVEYASSILPLVLRGQHDMISHAISSGHHRSYFHSLGMAMGRRDEILDQLKKFMGSEYERMYPVRGGHNPTNSADLASRCVGYILRHQSRREQLMLPTVPDVTEHPGCMCWAPRQRRYSISQAATTTFLLGKPWRFGSTQSRRPCIFWSIIVIR